MTMEACGPADQDEALTGFFNFMSYNHKMR